MDDHDDHETKTPEAQPPAKANNLFVPIAIIIAGALIAGAVYFSSGKTITSPTVAGNNAAANQQLPQGDIGSLDQMADIEKRLREELGDARYDELMALARGLATHKPRRRNFAAPTSL